MKSQKTRTIEGVYKLIQKTAGKAVSRVAERLAEDRLLHRMRCAEAYFNKGKTCMDNENFGAAFINYSKAIALVPDYGKAYLGRLSVYSATRCWPESWKEDMKKFLEITAKNWND